MEIVRIKCGQIFILSTDCFSVICEFCTSEFFTLEALHMHLHEHFPQSQTTIDDSSCGDSAAESVDADDFRELPAIGDEFNTPSDGESIAPEMQDYMIDFKDVIKYEVDFESVNDANPSNLLYTEYKSQVHIQSEAIEEPKPIQELQSNCESTVDDKRHSKRYPKRSRKPIEKSILSRRTDSSQSDDVRTHSRSLCKKTENRKKRGKVEFQCKFCGKLMNDKRERAEHENAHTGNRPYECRICSRTFASSSNLSGHLKWHENDRKYQCSLCEKSYLRQSRLSNHIRANHLPDTDPRRYFTCTLCNAKLKSVGQLERHRLKHRKEKFVCDICSKEFNTRGKIAEHMVVHSQQKPYKCMHCNETFAHQNYKSKHQRACLHKK